MKAGAISAIMGTSFYILWLWLCLLTGAEVWQTGLVASATGIFGVLLGMDM